LESVCAGNRTVGSNPTLSATSANNVLILLNLIDRGKAYTTLCPTCHFGWGWSLLIPFCIGRRVRSNLGGECIPRDVSALAADCAGQVFSPTPRSAGLVCQPAVGSASTISNRAIGCIGYQSLELSGVASSALWNRASKP
jgi:hypothetical protein